ncbi:40S ribosomal protein S24 [Hondaea fermentalgiana]|uniref:40S ribosomal protein S24 n=1 Tax=Hondaea fermentalgiana TaxID=2315210 RepID=A0A2R5GCS8_9STRA|nr:40S ribosomal protein S24 [Hondaea fermentalgiana]|eukprot:GBG28375.1 40S ribosomal protein S24 [Hondaea fermentalgiana]
MSGNNAVTIRTRKFVSNPLMARRQFILDVLHPGRAGVSKADLKEKIAKMFKVKDADSIILFNFKIAFGGGKSTGFCCIYNTVEDAKKLHAKHTLVRLGLVEAPVKKGRKGIKEAKNRGKKIRGVGRRLARKKAKRAE